MIKSWTFPGWEGTTTRVDIYAADDEIELLLNGIPLGRKPAGAAAQNTVSFEVTYTLGTLEAVAYTNGHAIGRTAL